MGLGLVLFCGLGTWQLQRRGQAAQERARWDARLAEAPFDASAPPDDPDLRRARVTGVPDWSRSVRLVGRWEREAPGYGLVVPVDVGGRWVLVDVGWVPPEEADAVVAREASVVGPRTWEGVARVVAEDATATEALPVEADGRHLYWRRPSPKAMVPGLEVAPFVVSDGPSLAEGQPSPDRDPPVAGWSAEPHQRPHGEYAATWFAIAGALVLFWVYGSLQEGEDARTGPLDPPRATA